MDQGLEQPDLLPEDDDLLSYFLSTEVDVAHAASAQAQGGQFPQQSPVGGFANRASAFTYSGASQGGPNGSGSTTPKGSPLSSPQEFGGKSTGGTDPDDRRARRLARNRESARQSRRRKKQYLELLEEKVAQLTEEIDQLRRQHLDAANETLLNLKQQMLDQLNQKLDMLTQGNPAINAELQRDLQMLQARFGPNCEERKTVVEYHFQQLSNLLLPPYAKFLLWMSSQNEDFFKGSGSQNKKQAAAAAAAAAGGVSTSATAASPAPSPSPSNADAQSNSGSQGLWPQLSSELGLTYEQEEKLKHQFRGQDQKATRAEKRKLAVAMMYLERLRTAMERRAAAVQSIQQQMFSVLTPAQQVVYLNWVEQNRDKIRRSGYSRGVLAGVSSRAVGGKDDEVSQILKKQDTDLTVEDVTKLLAELNK